MYFKKITWKLFNLLWHCLLDTSVFRPTFQPPLAGILILPLPIILNIFSPQILLWLAFRYCRCTVTHSGEENRGRQSEVYLPLRWILRYTTQWSERLGILVDSNCTFQNDVATWQPSRWFSTRGWTPAFRIPWSSPENNWRRESMS